MPALGPHAQPARNLKMARTTPIRASQTAIFRFESPAKSLNLIRVNPWAKGRSLVCVILAHACCSDAMNSPLPL